MKTLFLIRGCSGAGKTTFAESICEYVVSADDYFTDAFGNYNFDASKLGKAHGHCRLSVDQAMEAGVPHIAVANTFTRESEMEPYFDLAKRYGYQVVSLVVENRHGGVNIHNVPEEILVKQEARLRQNIKLR